MCLWQIAMFSGYQFVGGVPIDDTNMLRVGWFFNRFLQDQRPYVQKEIPSWEGPVSDQETGKWITSHVMNQDFAAWVGQGAIANRTKEHLGRSDRGVILMRKRFLDDLERIKDGNDPSGLIRDEHLNACVRLPIFDREHFLNGPTREQLADSDHPRTRSMLDFVFQAGQPSEIRQAYVEAMGL
ncbi:MAG: aromatic ring-hydroxylating dioxygenase subunit alpha, partial [Pseudomonadota bacterium]|nr:aromatic ring-hydroxylating dioxygenase subunit alpha [Pseudomonadota bacterium]